MCHVSVEILSLSLSLQKEGRRKKDFSLRGRERFVTAAAVHAATQTTMKTEKVSSVVYWLTSLLILTATVAAAAPNAGSVTYDGRALIINGERRILISGSIHYPRSTPEMWPSLIAKARQGGLDVIQTYVFWNLHEPQQGKYDFTGRADIVRFIKEVHAQGLYVSLRMGPFIQSEWNYGGLPFWLHDIPGIVYRSDNEPFKQQMEKFITMVVDMLKSEKLYASQGGPIILSQIENEYKTVEAAFHDKGPPYVQWAAKMAVGLQTGVPWVMCKQDDAPDPVINACNGLRCGETFAGPNSPNKPAIWTEDWTSNYQVYGAEPIIRSPEDIAFHVVLFIIAKGGSFVNYYMYHGGTNYGRTSAHFMITGYYDQSPLDEYGLIRQPKYGHLKDLHAAIKSSSTALLSGTRTTFSLGRFQQAFVFNDTKGNCSAFLVNNGLRGEVKVIFQNVAYKLAPKSISILPDCKTEAFNTGKVKAQYYTSKRIITTSIKFDSIDKWQEFKEDVVSFDKTTWRANTLLEHTSATKDASDYLWYTLRLDRETPNTRAKLNVYSRGHVLHAFVNGLHVGSLHGKKDDSRFTMQETISLNKGPNYVSLLSGMVGLPDSGAYMERRSYGLHTVDIDGSQFTNYSWGYQVGLMGEKLNIYTDSGSKQVQWSHYGGSSSQLLTWYKTAFDEPAGNDSVALNLGSMGKGEVWVNGQSIGRYWISFRTVKGNPSQTWYHIPRSFLIPKGNQLIILEEEQAKPLGITLDIITTSTHSIRKLSLTQQYVKQYRHP